MSKQIIKAHLTDEFIKESADRASKMKCSVEVAQHIIILEKRLQSIEEQLEQLWDFHHSRIMNSNSVDGFILK